MNIIVCIKQTPATANIQIDAKTGTLKREGMAAAINPFDEYAIEEAVRIKEKLPGSTISASRSAHLSVVAISVVVSVSAVTGAPRGF